VVLLLLLVLLGMTALSEGLAGRLPVGVPPID